MIKWDDELIHDLAARRAVLFLGAGISKNAVSASGERPKNWDEFLEEGASALGGAAASQVRACIARSDLLTACELLRKHLKPDKFKTLLLREYNSKGFRAASVHDDIVALDARFVVTTNFDRIYEIRANHLTDNSTIVKSYNDPSVNDVLRRRERCVLKIHGTIDAPDQAIFTRTDYARARSEHARFYELVDALLHTNTFVFLGASMRDPDIQLLLENHVYRFGRARPHYMVMADGALDSSVLDVMEDSMGIRALLYDSANHHEILANSVTELVGLVTAAREELAKTGNW